MENAKKVRNELQQEIGKITQSMKWLLIGGVVTLGMVLVKFFSGDIDLLYHSVEALIGVVCLAMWAKNHYNRKKLLQKLRVVSASPDSLLP